MSKLNVELYGSVLGTLSQNEKGFNFEVSPSVFEKYQLASTIMSLNVPLLLRYTVPQMKRSAVFFTELLPEGRNYNWLLTSLPHTEQNFYGMLRKYGKDIAGALTIYDPDDLSSDKKPEAEQVDDNEIRYLLEHMPQAALANSPITGKTSLGGIQGKIVLAKKDASWHRVYNGFPSTHIIKPVVLEYPTMIYDEEFCMQIAYKSGLTAYPIWIENFNGADALVIERYDRKNDFEGGRIHQEDFNQALGARGSEKYQEYGGKVSAKRIAQTLHRFGNNDDIEKFAAQLIFAIAIGNLDMHAKNVSILHLPDESVSLAPAYDQVALRHNSTDGRMALSVGGEYIHANISINNIVSELISWKCFRFSDKNETAAFIEKHLQKYIDIMDSITPNKIAYKNLKSNIHSFISNLLDGKNTGNI
ncbi:MAG: HipA domain-containing protein [Oscillospiraceae bacterium]|nr:HipA domain-containing protein [Oscillospiraceae bacterium]